MTRRPLGPGTQIEIEFERDGLRFNVTAVVVHAIRTPPALQQVRPSGMGIRFLDGGDVEALRLAMQDA